ncbi:solute carrier family 19 (thiamine transporter), member 2/3 [Pelomyxa schiedti]|nr:solute carrier family 19 (thiamine transporter), member 2/3 [Pelomyxa schiedti]
MMTTGTEGTSTNCERGRDYGTGHESETQRLLQEPQLETNSILIPSSTYCSGATTTTTQSGTSETNSGDFGKDAPRSGADPEAGDTATPAPRRSVNSFAASSEDYSVSASSPLQPSRHAQNANANANVNTPMNMSRRDLRMLILLVAYVFFHEFQPSAPFIVPYWATKGVDAQEVFEDVFPWSTYSQPAVSLVAVVLLWLAGVRPTLFSSSLCACGQSILAYFGSSDLFFLLILSEIVWAYAFGSLFAALAAKFSLVPQSSFHLVTSLNRFSSLLSILVSSLMGQLMLDNGLSYDILFYIAIGATAVASGLVFFMPKPILKESKVSFKETAKAVLRSYRIQGYSTAMWSLCYACIQAATALVETYWPTLFQVIAPDEVINGYTLAAVRTCGAAAALSPTLCHLIGFHAWKRFSTPLCIITVIVAGLGTLAISRSTYVIQALVELSIICAMSELTIVMCLAQVAIFVEKAPDSEYGWVFGVNYFMALLLQVLLQVVIQQLEIRGR